MPFKVKAYYFLIGFFCFFFYPTFGQDQKLVDSLIYLYNSESYPGNQLILLKTIAEQETNPEKQLQYSELLIKEASTDSLFDFLHSGYLQKGYALHDKGDFDASLESFLASLNYANRRGNQNEIGAVTISIADAYSELGNSNNAEVYYQQGIQILRKTDDSISLATALLNAGDEAFNIGKYDQALEYFEESGEIFSTKEYLIGTAYNKGNIGMVYAEQEKDGLAMTSINEAIIMLEELEDHNAISEYLTYMSDIYLKQDDKTSAISYSRKSLDLAIKYGLNKQISEANKKLAELHELTDNPTAAYTYYKEHINFRDSVRNIETIENMADLRTDYEVSQKQVEVDLLNQQKKTQRFMVIATLLGLLASGIIAFGLYRRNLFIKRTNKIIAEERDRSETLLLNILPKETAQELKKYGQVKAKKFESVSVLFTDFKGFTQFSEKLSPEKLVQTVSYYFSKFDEIIEKHNLEKIKTIGDSYMCAGGLPFPMEKHAHKMVAAAIEILTFVEQTKNDISTESFDFDIRLGINTGPVVAGVVGSKKFAYDIWGDTVNVAARMESNSEAGKINISQNTYELIKDQYKCIHRGEIEIKNRGPMRMYFVDEPLDQKG